MILAKAGNFILIGLSDKNVEQLTSDKPIKISLDDVGIPEKQLFIVHGKTEEDITKEFMDAGLLDPSIIVDKR